MSRASMSALQAEDELIDVDAVARMLGVSASFLYQKELPFVVKVGGRRMFSRAGIQRYIRNRQGAA